MSTCFDRSYFALRRFDISLDSLMKRSQLLYRLVTSPRHGRLVVLLLYSADQVLHGILVFLFL